jgi:hypothetical protein
MLVDEQATIIQRKLEGDYVPLAEYFTKFLVLFGREFSSKTTSDMEDNPIYHELMNSYVWSWNEELIPLGYLERIDNEVDGHSVFRLTDKAIAKIKEANND